MADSVVALAFTRTWYHTLCPEREFFHSGGGSGGYKVGFAVRNLLHSVAKVSREASGVRVLERVREDIWRWSENTSSLPHLRGL
jgi:hypothetical protein